MKRLLIVAVLGAAGCSPSLEKLAARCQAYGFVPGTDAMAQCVQLEDHAHRAAVVRALQNTQPRSVYVNRGLGW